MIIVKFPIAVAYSLNRAKERSAPDVSSIRVQMAYASDAIHAVVAVISILIVISLEPSYMHVYYEPWFGLFRPLS